MKRIIDYDKLEKLLGEEINSQNGLSKYDINRFWDILNEVEE